MSTSTTDPPHTRRDVFDDSLSGSQERPNIPYLQGDRLAKEYPVPHTLRDYRTLEGEEKREQRLRAIWKRLPKDKSWAPKQKIADAGEKVDYSTLTKERAESLSDLYWEELMQRPRWDWPSFVAYVDQKEDGKLLHIVGLSLLLTQTFPRTLVNISAVRSGWQWPS